MFTKRYFLYNKHHIKIVHEDPSKLRYVGKEKQNNNISFVQSYQIRFVREYPGQLGCFGFFLLQTYNIKVENEYSGKLGRLGK